MNIGALINVELISDQKLLKFTNLDTDISVKRTSLITAVYGEGIAVYEIGEEIKEGEERIKQKVSLILTKKLTKKKIREIIHQVGFPVIIH